MGYLILAAIFIGLVITYWQVAVALAILAVIVVLYRRRRPKQPTITVQLTTTDSRRDRSDPPVIRPDEAIAPPPATGWPALPPRPGGLNGFLADPPPASDREYAATTCPSCSFQFDPPPKAKRRCPSCGQDVFVRSGPDGKRHLLNASGVVRQQEEWAQFQRVRDLEHQTAFTAAQAAWREALKDAGFLVGEETVDVVGESYRHRELYGLMLALRERPDQLEVQAVAELVREPNNPKDPNAVKVLVQGVHAGYLSQWECEEWQPTLRRMEKTGRRAFVHGVLLGGRVMPDGVVGPIGVRLEDVPSLTAWT